MSSEERGGLLAVWVLVGWTLFVWVNRIRNVVADPALDGSERLVTLLMSVGFVVLALVVAVIARRGRGPALRYSVGLLAGLTTVVWVVRAIAIAARGDHPVGFVVVHVVLAVVSVGLAVWAVLSDLEKSHKLRVTD